MDCPKSFSRQMACEELDKSTILHITPKPSTPNISNTRACVCPMFGSHADPTRGRRRVIKAPDRADLALPTLLFKCIARAIPKRALIPPHTKKSPKVPFEMPTFSCMVGMCETQDPKENP